MPSLIRRRALTITPTPPAPPQLSHSKRYLVVREMMTTERGYVKDLQTLRDVFVAPLIADASCHRPSFGQIVSVSAHATLFFSNVDRMSTLNADLLAKLEDRFASSEWTEDGGSAGRVGDIFERYAPLFKIYSQYARGFEGVNALVVEMSKNSSALRLFLEACGADPRVNNETVRDAALFCIVAVV